MYPVLDIKNLSKKFNNNTAVNGVNLQVEKGDIFGFLGPNGAGKTTTIRMILGLVHSDGGEIYINGIDTRKNFKKAIEKVAAIVETPRFYPYLSAYKNLELIANLHGDIPASRIYELLELVGLKDRSKSKVKTFSLGMKQRLGIARALINDPDFVILDEPTNGLDPQGIREVRDLIRFLNAEKNITFFISTHILSEVEQICNKVAILKEGSIIDSGYVEDILSTETESLVIEIKEIGKAIDILSELSRFGIIEESINSSNSRLYCFPISHCPAAFQEEGYDVLGIKKGYWTGEYPIALLILYIKLESQIQAAVFFSIIKFAQY